MARQSQRFIAAAQQLTARDLIRTGDANLWNDWRQNVDIFGDHLRWRVDLSQLSLTNADLRRFNLTNMSFLRANLAGSDMRGVDCAHSDFHESDLIGCDLSGANLRHTRLSRAYMRNARLDHADLRGSDLRRASLTGASLLGANICGLDLSSTRGLTQEQIEDAIGDNRTRVPEHLEIPETWIRYDREAPKDDDLERLRLLPATVEVTIRSGVVRLAESAGDALFASSIDAESVRQEILEDIRRMRSRFSNIPELGTALDNYLKELDKPSFDIIIVGIRGLKIDTIFNHIMQSSADDAPELLPDVAGSLRACLIQHYLLVSQSHKWKRFLDEAAIAPYKASDRRTAEKYGSSVKHILEENASVVDPQVPAELEKVAVEFREKPDDALAMFNLFASIENLFRSLISWTVREGKRLARDAWGQFRDQLAKYLGTGMATLVIGLFTSGVATGLAALYPERFAWLIHAIELLASPQ